MSARHERRAVRVNGDLTVQGLLEIIREHEAEGFHPDTFGSFDASTQLGLTFSREGAKGGWLRARVFACVDHKGHWPVGVASVVIATDENEARALLGDELTRRGLGGGSFTLRELDAHAAHVLGDGNY